MRRWWIVALALSACAPQTLTMPELGACEPAPEAQVLAQGWRMAQDAQDVGLSQAWYATDYEDSGWQNGETGVFWEQFFGEYDGVAWYRRNLVLSPESAYLYISDVDDSGTLWLNGQEVAQFSAETPDAVLNLGEYAAMGERLTLAVRVVDEGVYGGIKSAVRLASTPNQAIAPDKRLEVWARQAPDWLMPTWTRGGALAWTMTGAETAKDEALVSRHGALAPMATAPSVELWLYNPVNQQTFMADAPHFGLIQNAPIPQWEWQVAEGAQARALAFVDSEDGALRWRTWWTLAGDWRLLVVVRPFGVNKLVRPIYQAATQEGRVWLNGAPYLVAGTRPTQAGSAELHEGMHLALQGQAPQAATLPCSPVGEGMVTLVYDLRAGETVLDFALPSQAAADLPRMDVDAGQRLEATVQVWREAQNQARFSLPDERLQAAMQASLGYLLLASDPDGPHPGPLAHDAVWVRDAAYMGLALLMAGHDEVVRGYLSAIYDEQEASGRVPPIQGANVPWFDDEWDAQGQAIFLLYSYYAYTGDRATLERYYPQALKAADFIRQLRQNQLDHADARLRGILPPSLSAEDLGPKDHHYTWDNWWALIGLQTGVQLAEWMQDSASAEWMRAEESALRRALEQAIAEMMGVETFEQVPYLPASAEVTDNSAMARGNVPTLWPHIVGVDETILQDAFEVYHQRWIAPYGGGYLHREGQFWTYGGVELAHAYLRLGRGDVLHQILGWTLEHQTLAGTYAWAEQVSPVNYGFTGGDMPHAWMAASWYALLREMLFSEEGLGLDAGQMVLFRQVPAWWFEAGRQVLVEDAPTRYGRLNLRTQGDLQSQAGVWQGVLNLTVEIEQTNAPVQFVWDLPQMPSRVEGAVQVLEKEGGVRLFIDNQAEIRLFFGSE